MIYYKDEVSLDYLHLYMEDLAWARNVSLCAAADAGGVADASGAGDEPGRRCELYTLGDGLCIVEVQGPRQEAAVVRSACAPPLYLCPLGAPLAFLLLPKAASTSLTNWAGRIDGLHGRWAALRAAAGRGGDPAVAELVRARFANTSLSRDAVLRLTQRATGARDQVGTPRRTLVFGDIREGTGALDVVPPASDCAPCCLPGPWRTKVVVGRHPLLRLVSYFRMAWAEKRYRGNFSSWARFPAWLQHVAGVQASEEVASVELPEDEYHTRPLSRWLEVLSLDPSEVVVLRMERLDADFEALGATLCREHSLCRPLPPLRRQRLEGGDRRAGQANDNILILAC